MVANAQNPHADIVPISLPTPFPIGPANSYLIKADPPMLVDTGPQDDAAYDHLVAALQSQGLSLSDVGVVLITHGHLDHMGLLARVLDESDAVAYSHPQVVEQWGDYDAEAKAGEAFYGTVFRAFGAPKALTDSFVALREACRGLGASVTIDHGLDDGATVGPLRAHHVPGHSPTDVLFVDETRRLAFSGDHLLKHADPSPLVRRPIEGQPRAKGLVEYQDSLRKTRALGIVACYPGHGAVFDDVDRAIDRLLDRQEKRTQKVLDLVGDDALTPYQVCCRLFPNLSMRGLHLALSAAVGHLEVLEERGLLVSEIRGEVYHYFRPSDRKNEVRHA